MAYADTEWTPIAFFRTGRGTIVEESRVLYSAKNADDNGEWQEGKGVETIEVLATISSTQTVNIVGSNAATAPAASSHGQAIATALTSTGRFELAKHQIPKFWKVYLSSTSGGSSTVTAKVTKQKGDTLTVR